MPDPGDTQASGGDGGVDDTAHDEAYCPACNESFAMTVAVCPHDGAKLIKFKAQQDPMLGRVLDQRYQVRAPLGKGGMGTVYRAWQLSVDREVALKVVHGKLAADRTAAKRFLREARLASRLSQPNIVNVYDFGQTDDGVLYLVMELLRGRTLGAELKGERRLATKRALTIALQLCDALEAAHAQTIIHRDLKPGNIVILDEPPGRDLIKVLDFGLAKSLLTDTSSRVTNTDAILGTPLYMAPESVQGQPADHRTDLYALGCLLYEMLSGAPPFVDSSVNLVMAKHMTEAPAPLPVFVPAPLRELALRLLAKDPAERPQSAAEVRAALEAVVDSGVAAASVNFDERPDTVPDIDRRSLDLARSVGLAETVAGDTPMPSIDRRSLAVGAATASVAAPRSRRGLMIGVGLVGAGAAAALAFALTRRSPASSTPVAVPPDAATLAPPIDARPAEAAPDAARPVDARPAPPDARPAVRKPPTTRPPTTKPPTTKPPREPDIDFLP
ncbi:MAG: protein kinase [Kofleriaceae bacterium]